MIKEISTALDLDDVMDFDFFDFLTLKMPDWENRKQKLDQYK